MDQKITESHLPGQYLYIALFPRQYLDIALAAGQYKMYCLALAFDPLTQSVTIKYSMRGGGEWQIQHEAKPECCICQETPPQVLYFIVQHEYTVLLLICWFCVGGLVSIFCSDGGGAMLLGRLVL